MIYRDFEERINLALQFFPCVTLTGARQTGKTTLLKKMLPNYNYVSLDLPSIASMAEETPEVFFEKYKTPLIIDEVQYAPELFRYLKDKLDKDRHQMGQLVLTGSQKFELMKNLSESLAGRTAVLELEGLSWNEYKNYLNEENADFDTYIFRGGFPELTREQSFPLDMFFSSYLATYLERDVRQLVNVTNLRTFEQFIRLLAVRNANQLDMTDIANNLGISSKTIASWISVLETSGQITLLQPWFGNSGKRIVKTPKVYFNDTGLLCWLLGIEKDNLKSSPFIGNIFETVVFAELRKLNKLNGNKKQIYYYRDVGQTEVDFFIVGNGCKMIEVKNSVNPKSDAASGMKKLYEQFLQQGKIPQELSPLSFFIVSNTSANYPLKISTKNEEIEVNVINAKEITEKCC